MDKRLLAWVGGIASVILAAMSDCSKNLSLTVQAPEESDQPLAYWISWCCHQLPILNCFAGEFDCTAFVLLGYLVVVTFPILYASSGSKWRCLALSLFVIFDEATAAIMHRNYALGIQMILVAHSISSAQALCATPPGSIDWLTNTFWSVFHVVVALLIMPESAAALIPVAVQVFIAFRKRTGLAKTVLTTIRSRLRLLPISAVLLTLFLLLARSVGFPRCAWIVPSLEALRSEIMVHPHNLVILALVPTACFAVSFVGVSKAWVLSLLATAAVILFFPISGIVDDLLVRTVLAKYILLLTVGTTICDRKLGSVYTAVSVVSLLTSLVFFISPIQRPAQV
jgi:hypothetical protein